MRLLFTLFLCFLSTSLLGQYQIRPATLTDRNDKVLSGFIRDYDWNSSPQFIEFDEDSSGSMKQLPIQTIQKLVIKDGPFYQGLYLKVPYYFKTPIRLGGNPIQRIDSTYYLAELLLDSDVIKLYRFFDEDTHPRFVIAKNDSLVTLNDIHVRVINKDKAYDYDEPVFRKTLQTVLADSPALNTGNILYTESSLINILKQYLSFRQLTARTYLTKKKFDKATFGLGAYTSFWGDATENTIPYGLTLQVLLTRRLANFFILVDVGGMSKKGYSLSNSDLQLGIYGGRYFGRHAIQGKLYTGLSTIFGPLDTGIGVSYRKMISVEMRYPVFAGLLNGLHGFGANSDYIPPLLNLRAIFPLGHANKH